MNKIILFSPANGTLNSGDFIIEKYLKAEMSFLFSNSIIAEIGTHMPINHFYQNIKKNTTRKACDEANFKFLCGTNLIKTSLLRLSPDWSLTPSSCAYYKNSISIGIGLDNNSRFCDSYTKLIYKNIFSKNFIHSTRDEKTKLFLESLGFKSINTGCPSLWGLTEDFCRQIPRERNRNVIFTLTDYNKSPENDKRMIDILASEYDHLYFWIQGFHDLDYLYSLTNNKKIQIIGHSLEAYENLLATNHTIDYVGTRLHAGIFAIRHKVRSIIVSIDNRTIDMKETYDLPLIDRNLVKDELRSYINSDFSTKINIPIDKINKWKEQFKYTL